MKRWLFIAALCLAVLPGWSAWGAGQGEIVLGVPTSLTTLEGAESLKAVHLAVEEINRAGGVRLGKLRRRFRLEPYDLDDVNPGIAPVRSVAKLRAFIEEKKPHALLVGPFRSEVLLESMDLLAEKKLPTLGTIAMSPAVDAVVLRNPKYKYFFRVSLNNKYLVAYLIESMKLLAAKYGFRKVFILNQDVAWARSTASLMIKLYFDRAGWQIAGQKSLAHGTASYEQELELAAGQGAQVLLAIFDMPSSAALARQWRDQGSSMALCGFISPVSGPGAWSAFDGGIAGVMNTTFELGNIPSLKYPPASAFYRAFQARYGHPLQAGHGPAPSYDAVHILARALERAGTLDPDKLVEALRLTDYQGVQGRVHFHRGQQAVFGQDPRRDSLACVVQWAPPGRRVIVYPPSIAEGEIELRPAAKR